MSYIPSQIESKWQTVWEQKQVFKTGETSAKPKYYVLDMFPYPSSTGLHVGHPEGYTATDILARYKRAKGFNVLHPMGWDAFGLPAEQFALKTGVHPEITTQDAIKNFTRQLKSLGFSYDWSREIATCDPDYYKWTQYIFLKLYERGLAYQNEVPVNWCPELKTVLANEEVVDGKSERGGHPVFRVPMKQWMLKITAYAERLLKDLDTLDWPESTKELQRNWIGKSEGLQLKFFIDSSSDTLEVFTTRPDTLFGVSYLVLAPEHPLVQKITHESQLSAVKNYQALAAQKSEVARQEQNKEKTGAFTGAYALHPVTKKLLPIWIADYVMLNYGTGAVMAVPAHDDRDYDFAKAFQLPILPVVRAMLENRAEENSSDCAFTGQGICENSDFLNGLDTITAKEKMIVWAEDKKIGKRTVQYKLRDWLFSRQRYWGEPFPILKNKDTGAAVTLTPVDLNDLPVVLPRVKSYEPSSTGESPLAAIREWVEVKDPKTGKMYLRETDTMPGSAGSSWYFLRYIDPKNTSALIDLAAEKYWMPVDLYLGGPEHAVGHLLYSRFWMKVLFDCGLVSHHEPFQKLVHQGMILGEDGEKMSKSRGNVINPDLVVEKYGADTLRLYEMFMGPLERDKPWSMQAIEGVFRFLNRAWRIFLIDEPAEKLIVTDSEPTAEDLKITHKTIKKVTEDIESLRFNTAISQMMIFVNHFTKESRSPKACLKPFIQLIQPFAPHFAEELWFRLGETTELSYAEWPSFDPAYAKDDLISIAVQVMGKTKGTIEVEPEATQDQVVALAQKMANVAPLIEGKTIKKLIFVPGKIVNFVVA